MSLLDSHGNEYDLSHLIRDGKDTPWVAIDTDVIKSHRFYINVCKPLPPVKDCPGQYARPRPLWPLIDMMSSCKMILLGQSMSLRLDKLSSPVRLQLYSFLSSLQRVIWVLVA